MISARAIAPSCLTLLGLGVSTLGCMWRWPLALLFGLVCDVLDGAVARRLGSASRFGARLDWHVDVCIGAVLAWLVWPPALVGLAVWSGLASTMGWRVSGRAWLTVVAIGVWW
ncbi:MAG: CDP-alcohol phosphatidyltransferase family protein [Labilithrix sp.]|nr:CDP-alcohol phosphatidyltransferase family protein [Labilithrix sp.]